MLVVDDEASIRSITQHTLEAFGYRVLSARDGAEAVALYAKRGNEVAVVLTDAAMPVMDGSAEIQALRRLNPAVKIIATRGLPPNQPVASGSHFLRKPYTAEEVLKKLRSVLAPAVAEATDSEPAGGKK